MYLTKKSKGNINSQLSVSVDLVRGCTVKFVCKTSISSSRSLGIASLAELVYEGIPLYKGAIIVRYIQTLWAGPQITDAKALADICLLFLLFCLFFLWIFFFGRGRRSQRYTKKRLARSLPSIIVTLHTVLYFQGVLVVVCMRQLRSHLHQCK